MIKKDLIVLISAGLLFAACDGAPNPGELDHSEKKGVSFNGVSFNGVSFNGVSFNGVSFNGVSFNGFGWTGSSWMGLGWNGGGFSNTAIPSDWGLDNWVNDTDADGDTVLTEADRELRLKGLAYWTGCACASNANVQWTGNNPYPAPHTETRSFQGGLGLAPTWCTGTGPVPVDEQQSVSACLLSRVNTKDIHNIISLRGYDSSLKLIDNEKLFMAYPEGQFFGNLWDSHEKIYDPGDGFFYDNTKAFTCYYPWGNANAQLARDLQLIIGRTSEWDTSGPMKTTLACLKDGNVDGSFSDAYDASGNLMPPQADPMVGSDGLNNSTVNGYPDGVTGQQYATWHNNKWRKISSFLGDWADLEVENWKPAGYKCSTDCANVDGCSCYKDYCSRAPEGGGNEPNTCEFPSQCNNCSTVVSPLKAGSPFGKSAACKDGTDCVRGRKLVALTPGYWLRVMFMRPFDLLTETWVTGTANPHKAGTLQFRYTNGTAAPLSILIKDLIRNSSIAGTNFVPTGDWENYQNKTVYPVYPGRSTFSGTTPGIDIAIAADPASPAFPHLDYVQMWVGPPFGVKPREQYDDGFIRKDPIPEGGKAIVSSSIQVGDDGFKSDFEATHMVRVRVQASGVKLSELRVQLVHGEKIVTLQGSSFDSDGWSGWVKDFTDDSPSRGAWQVRVSDLVVNGTAGVFLGAGVEFQQ